MLFIKLVLFFILFGLFFNNNNAFTYNINECNNCKMYSIYSSNVKKKY